jgi:hypothetical protein
MPKWLASRLVSWAEFSTLSGSTRKYSIATLRLYSCSLAYDVNQLDYSNICFAAGDLVHKAYICHELIVYYAGFLYLSVQSHCCPSTSVGCSVTALSQTS